MIQVALIGAGGHSTGSHASALQRYVTERPGRVRLTAVCDLNGERARTTAATFGFARAVTSVTELFRPGTEKPAVCVAVLPVAAMRVATPPLFEQPIPFLIEKPLGANLQEAEALVAAAVRAGATDRVMVSFNRRYDPAITCAATWLHDQTPFRYLRATMTRSQRTEPDFVWGTGVHLIDAVEHLAGPLTLRSGGAVCPGDGVRDAARIARLTARHGGEVLIEILPTAGTGEETIRVTGQDYQVDIQTGTVPPWRVRAVRNLTVALDAQGPADEPYFVSNGSYAETAAFLDAVVEGRPLPRPNLADALASSRLADGIERLE